ncbi:hypothetical protein FBY33_1727 [Arthrobacter sp. SLBN-112]|nr:hypothetical protein FBY33_1727 [Arthrobacter sp. SLBN-112]
MPIAGATIGRCASVAAGARARDGGGTAVHPRAASHAAVHAALAARAHHAALPGHAALPSRSGLAGGTCAQAVVGGSSSRPVSGGVRQLAVCRRRAPPWGRRTGSGCPPALCGLPLWKLFLRGLIVCGRFLAAAGLAGRDAPLPAGAVRQAKPACDRPGPQGKGQPLPPSQVARLDLTAGTQQWQSLGKPTDRRVVPWHPRTP